MFLRRLVMALVFGLVAAACGVGGGDEVSSAAAARADEIEAEVEGISEGCGALLALDEIGVQGDGTATNDQEALRKLIAASEEAARAIEGESEAATLFIDLNRDIATFFLEELEEDPDVSDEALSFAVLVAFSDRIDEVNAAEEEAIAFFDRRCDGRLQSVFFGGTAGTTSVAGATTDAAVDQTTAEAAVAETTTTLPPEPIAVATVIETSSVGALATYANVEFEVGEIWRTNQLPVEALAGIGEGTEDEWVLVELRGTNLGGNDFGFFGGGDFLWIDEGGDTVPAEARLTPQGDSWVGTFPTSSSERGFVVFPGPLGASEGASLQLVSGNQLPITIPLGVGFVAEKYPIQLATGAVGETASADVAGCGFDLVTEVRGAEVTLNAVPRDAWERVTSGLRYVVIDLAITPTAQADNFSSCSFLSFARNTLDARLELDNGDLVAVTALTFGSIDDGATELQQLVFEVEDDVTSAVLRGLDGAELAQWELALPPVN